jgi:hypothetical protein
MGPYPGALQFCVTVQVERKVGWGTWSVPRNVLKSGGSKPEGGSGPALTAKAQANNVIAIDGILLLVIQDLLMREVWARCTIRPSMNRTVHLRSSELQGAICYDRFLQCWLTPLPLTGCVSSPVEGLGSAQPA